MVFTIIEMKREKNGSWKSKTIAYQQDLSFLKGFSQSLGILGCFEDRILVLDAVYNRENLNMNSELVFHLVNRNELS